MGVFQVLQQTLLEPQSEMVPESCSSQSKGVPGGSKNISAPASRQLCAVGVLGGHVGRCCRQPGDAGVGQEVITGRGQSWGRDAGGAGGGQHPLYVSQTQDGLSPGDQVCWDCVAPREWGGLSRSPSLA